MNEWIGLVNGWLNGLMYAMDCGAVVVITYVFEQGKDNGMVGNQVCSTFAAMCFFIFSFEFLPECCAMGFIDYGLMVNYRIKKECMIDRLMKCVVFQHFEVM